jgi:methylenetetrahydrofolate dehydrogenase (NADP+) / methenyltetrahydrofolate cyclohydrolase
MKILDGKATSIKILDSLKEDIANMKVSPCLAVILIGDNPASAVYVKNKAKACEKIGVKYKEYSFNNEVTEKEVFDTIQTINKDSSIHGLIVQLPVPDHVSVPKILKEIDPKKDVDGFTAYNIGKMVASKDFEDLPPATPAGIVRLLDEYNINVTGLNTVVLGRSNIVGKPIASMLLNRGATVTVCHSRTKDVTEYTKKADLIVVAVGIPGFLKADMINKGVIVIDVGIHKKPEGGLCGDSDFENISSMCSFITPVPGGVGPMTIAQLMVNVVGSAQK